jgi:N-carbamoylputrescine amidase
MIVKIGLAQLACRSDPARNLQEAIERVREAAAGGAQVVCLPELFKNLYFCQSEAHENFALAEAVPGPTTDLLCAEAARLGVVLIAPLFERRAPGVYHNTAAVIDADGKYLGMYRKMHIPEDPLYHEKFYFTPGDLGFPVWNTRFGRMAVLICWDQWYPEAARAVSLQGAEIVFYPTAIGWHPSEKAGLGEAQHASWETIQRSHAIANGVFVAAVNRTGHEGLPTGGVEFWGASFVAAPDGRILARAAHDREETLVVPCDLGQIDVSRTHWPFLRDRRIDAYQDVLRRFSC